MKGIVDAESAAAFVSSLSDLTHHESRSRRAKAAKTARVKREGGSIYMVGFPREANEDLTVVRRKTGLPRDDAIAEALRLMRVYTQHRALLSPQGRAALGVLMNRADAPAYDVVDFALRFTLQELQRRRRVRLLDL